MPSFKLEQFGGMLPAWDDHLIPAGQAVNSENSYIFSGALNGWRRPKVLHTLNNPDATSVYRIPITTEGTATNTLTFLTNIVEDDQVRLGEEIYTFRNVLDNNIGYQVLVGATANDSAANLFAAFTIGNGQGTTYSNGTCQNPAISQITDANTLLNNTIKVVAPDFGEAYNVTVTTDSTGGTRVGWATPTFTGGLNQTFDSAITSNSYWLEFEDHDTDVIRSPVVDDRFHRYYFASPSLPPKYNTYDRIVNNLPHWLLGINPPGCAPGVSVAGGGDTATLGRSTSSSAANYTVNANQVFLMPITPDGAMELDTISFMPFSTSATINWVGLVYEDNNGVPGLIVGQSEVTTGISTLTETSVSFLSPPGLNTNQTYWIGMMADEDFAVKVADDTFHTGVQFANTFTNGGPGVAPSVTTGRPDLQLWATMTTAAVLEARAYVYTWVTAYEEESAPSPPTLVNGWNNGVWTINIEAPPLDDQGVLRNITTIRVYRTVASVTGTATYYWLCDYNISGNSISDITDAVGILPGTVTVTGNAQLQDTLGDDVIANNIQLPSTTWFPPPALEGFVSMPNGIIAGFKGNEIWFCEPYRPHAWPPGYVITTAFPIVGMAVVMQSLVICTSSNPYVVNGVHPSGMALTKVELPEPCTSRGSIVSGDRAVYYTSPNGLIAITQDGAGSNYTQTWITREKWQQLTPQKYVHAILLVNMYFAFGVQIGDDTSVAQQGFTVELATSDGQSFTIWPQPGGHRVGFNLLSSHTAPPPGSEPAPASFGDLRNVQQDPWTGVGLVVSNGNVYYYDFTDTAPTIQPYVWRSKKYQQVNKKNFEAMKVYFTVPPGTATINATRKTDDTDDPSWDTLDLDRYGYVRVYADDQLVTVRELRTSGELLRILSGFKAETWQWEFEGRVLISNMQAATTVKELSGV